MRAFSELYTALDETTKTNGKIEALVTYFRNAAQDDAAWAIHFLIGRRINRLIESRKAGRMGHCGSRTPGGGFLAKCYFATGDFAETVALLLPEPISSTDKSLRYWVEERLLPLREWNDEQQRESMVFSWLEMDERQRFVWNKLITGEFRVGVSQSLVMRSLAEVAGVPTETIAHRLMGDWQPDAAFYERLIAKDAAESDLSRPYPFFLAYPIEGSVQDLGDPAEWLAEWKWDGIRSRRVIRRAGQTFIWTRGEDLATDRFPEIVAFCERMPDGTAIDGEIMPWKEGFAAAVYTNAEADRPQNAGVRRFWPKFRWRCSHTTCSNGAAKTFAGRPSKRGGKRLPVWYGNSTASTSCFRNRFRLLIGTIWPRSGFAHGSGAWRA